MKSFKADLHIHSCLSPCSDLEMSPKGIVAKSLEMGLDLIAVCDHNTAGNTGAVVRAGNRKGLFVLPGMEINSREEVHVLAIFGSEGQALAMQEIVFRNLRGTNRPDLFGEQVLANEFDEVEGFEDRMLIGATELGLEEVLREVHRIGGLCIASHVDRPSFSILSQLGFIPPDLELDALEVSRQRSVTSVRSEMTELADYSLVTFSDSHFLKDIGRPYTSFFLETPCLDELRLALAGKSGRRIIE